MVWLVAAIIFQSASVAFAKQAALSTQLQDITSVFVSPYYIASVLMLGFQAFCWVLVVKRFPLSFAYPFSSLSLIVNLIVAAVVFGETLVFKHYIGISLILVGIYFLYSLPPRTDK